MIYLPSARGWGVFWLVLFGEKSQSVSRRVACYSTSRQIETLMLGIQPALKENTIDRSTERERVEKSDSAHFPLFVCTFAEFSL
jgi:hypothetical protein